MKIYYMIYSWQLIPEVMLFKTVEDLKEAWIDYATSYEAYTKEEAAKSFKDGWAEWHDVELRWGAEDV